MSMPTRPKTRRLARGDVGVAGTDDLVDRGHGRGAEGERADRLRAADAQDAVHARRARRRRAPSAFSSPPGVGVTITSSGTPATFAATALISTDDG